MAKKFLRRDAHKKKRLGSGWRRPKGLQNKMRLATKGHSKKVKPGFGKKKSEIEIITITNKSQLKEVDPKTQAINIAKVSKRNKLEILEEAQKLQIKIINLNVKRYVESAEKALKEKQEAAKKRDEKLKQKQEKEKKAEKKAEEKKKEEEKKPELTDEEKKKQEKQEKDKILTKGA